MRTAICIINWNGFEDTKRCIESVRRYGPSFHVFLLENGSGQEKKLGSLLDEHITLTVSSENLGFAGGCNLLIERAMKEGYEAIYLLNNDTLVTDGFLDEPLALFDDPSVGFVTSKLIFADSGLVENAGHRHLNSSDVIPEGRNADPDKFCTNRRMLSGCGAALLLRSSMLKDVGLFEEDFFLSYEDVELTYRASTMGWRGWFCASSAVHHRHNASINAIRSSNYYIRSQENALLAYFYNTPLAVMALNFPWFCIRIILIVVSMINPSNSLGRYALRAIYNTVFKLGMIHDKRKLNIPRHKATWYEIWSQQRNCIPAYFKMSGLVLKSRVK
jgi:GT2 family glycosyltransferase